MKPVGGISALRLVLAARQTIHAYSRGSHASTDDGRQEKGTAWVKEVRDRAYIRRKGRDDDQDRRHYEARPTETRDFNFKCKRIAREWDGSFSHCIRVRISMRVALRPSGPS
jgi:hypothetical protein